MRVSIIGVGYVGLVSGTMFADFGNDVICMDIDEEKINKLQNGTLPFYEQGLESKYTRNKEQDRLAFTTDTKAAVHHGDVIFICVGTPQGKDGEANLDYVMQAAEDIGTHMNEEKVVVIRSTVPVGTNERVQRRIRKVQAETIDFDVANNPEFMREGAAIRDFQNPDRVIVGSRTDKAEQVLDELFKHVERVNRPIMHTTPENA
ncbi:MAG: nucleotide sugar dehydrogenase, partial [Halobacteriaceae archaeon]